MCEKHQIVMRGSGEEVLDEITFVFFGSAFARGHADHTFAAAALRSKCTHGRALDESAMRDADDTALVCDEILHVDLGFIRRQFGQAWCSVFVTNFAQFLLDDG